MKNSDYFSYLYEIARCLNKEFSLNAALKTALEKSVELLELETGWIWLMQENKGVYLAASYNLPPALKDFPERLSGTCYCMEKYFSDKIDKSTNISEIACSRLYNLKSGTKDLKFHATVPIKVNEQKIGLINLVSKDHHELKPIQLCVLNTIAELVGVAVQRTRGQDAQHISGGYDKAMVEILQRVFKPKLQELTENLELVKSITPNGNQEKLIEKLNATAKLAGMLNGQLSHILEEYADKPTRTNGGQFQFSPSSLTDRELELLALVRKGYTNRQIAETVFISERTVKFHMSSILQKLSAGTRTEAVDIALKRGLISLST